MKEAQQLFAQIKSPKPLCLDGKVTKKVSVVDVKDLSILVDHDIIWMSITYAEYEGRHAVSGATVGKVLERLLLSSLVILQYPLVQLSTVQLHGSQTTCLPLDLVNCLCVPYCFDHTNLGVGGFNVR